MCICRNYVSYRSATYILKNTSHVSCFFLFLSFLDNVSIYNTACSTVSGLLAKLVQCADGFAQECFIITTCSCLPYNRKLWRGFKPQRMREGYGSLCVCLYVCYHASCLIPCLYVENKVPLSFLRRSQGM